MNLPTNEQINIFVEQVKPAVEKVAQSLSVTTQELWKIGILKQRVDGIMKLLLGLAFLGGTIWSIKILLKQCREAEREKEGWIIGIIIAGLIGGVAIFASLQSALLHLLVPQYTLIIEIIGLIK